MLCTLGFGNGAALFPQVTGNGEECHSEWEITFEEIHRNNIIVYAILQHATLTGTLDYIARYGLEVMIAVSRFWSQRVSFSPPKQKYDILGVTAGGILSNGYIFRKTRNAVCSFKTTATWTKSCKTPMPFPTTSALLTSIGHGTASCAPATSSKVMFCLAYTYTTSTSTQKPFAVTLSSTSR